MTFRQWRHYSAATALVKVDQGEPSIVLQPSLKCYLRLTFVVHFLFAWGAEITILSSRDALVL